MSIIILTIRAVVEVPGYGAKRFTIRKARQFRWRKNIAFKLTMKWSDIDSHREINPLRHEIHLVIVAKCKHFDKLLQYHQQ